MREIQASEAEALLLRLLDEVERGETILITRHGRAVARLVLDAGLNRVDVNRAVDRIEQRRPTAGFASAAELFDWRHEGHQD